MRNAWQCLMCAGGQLKWYIFVQNIQYRSHIFNGCRTANTQSSSIDFDITCQPFIASPIFSCHISKWNCYSKRDKCSPLAVTLGKYLVRWRNEMNEMELDGTQDPRSTILVLLWFGLYYTLDTNVHIHNLICANDSYVLWRNSILKRMLIVNLEIIRITPLDVYLRTHRQIIFGISTMESAMDICFNQNYRFWHVMSIVLA